METTTQTRNKSFTGQVNKFKSINRHLVWYKFINENPQGLTAQAKLQTDSS